MACKSHWLSLLIPSLLLASCDAGQGTINPVETTGSQASQIPASHCGHSVVLDLAGPDERYFGYIELLNDSSRLFLMYEASPEFALADAKIGYGRPMEQAVEFPQMLPGKANTYWANIPVQALPDCGLVMIEIRVKDNSGKILDLRPASSKELDISGKIRFCIQRCQMTDDCMEGAVSESFRAYGQKQWLLPNDSIHDYFKQNFSTFLQAGLQVGCQDLQKLSSFNGLLAWVQQHNPGAERDLAGEVAALSLNIAFDAADSSFSPAKRAFSGLLIASGDFAGWTTQGLLEEGNAVLGGCPSNYSSAQMTKALKEVNESLLPENRHLGMLVCE